jgi:hypothetical protein
MLAWGALTIPFTGPKHHDHRIEFFTRIKKVGKRDREIAAEGTPMTTLDQALQKYGEDILFLAAAHLMLDKRNIMGFRKIEIGGTTTASNNPDLSEPTAIIEAEEVRAFMRQLETKGKMEHLCAYADREVEERHGAEQDEMAAELEEQWQDAFIDTICDVDIEHPEKFEMNEYRIIMQFGAYNWYYAGAT